MAVEFHLAAPGSQGLFHGAISQSPPCVGLATLDQVKTTETKRPTGGSLCGVDQT